MLFFFEETVAVTGVVLHPCLRWVVQSSLYLEAISCKRAERSRLSYWQRAFGRCDLDFRGAFDVCAPRSSNKLGFEVVEVTTNGIDYTDDEVMLEYRRAITVSAVSPTSGPRRGGTARNFWRGLRSTDSLTCRFGGLRPCRVAS